MTLQEFTTKLQALCHEGHSMKEVAVCVGRCCCPACNMDIQTENDKVIIIEVGSV